MWPHGCSQDVQWSVLRLDEAWKLFQTKVGKETLDGLSDIPKLAEIVTKGCDGLPLARAMAHKKIVEEWNHAIQVLRRSASKFPGMDKKVCPLLKFSFDSLPSDTIRPCLLYCSLFPEDYRILGRDLIDCWIGEGYVDTNDHTSGAHNEGYYNIGALLHACLLEEDGEDSVKLHDVIRDMALWIACELAE